MPVGSSQNPLFAKPLHYTTNPHAQRRTTKDEKALDHVALA